MKDYHFFYEASELDSFSVNLQVKQVPFNELLRRLFLHSSFHFAIDSLHYVIVSKHALPTGLEAGFFSRKNLENDTLSVTDLAEETPGKEKIKSSAENRLYEIGIKTNTIGNGKATLAGYVRDVKNGEPIIGASVYLDTLSIGVTTDQFGYYSLTLRRGRHTLHISSAGMKDTRRQVMLYSDGKLNIELSDYVASLKAVTVVSEKNSNTKRIQMGVEKLNIKTIKQVATVFGETDILRVVLTLPGVTSVGEASTGFNVRGGSTDQNLILFNNATIYNPSHLFGFFSAFNPDVVKEVELY
jgi:hypothetical protein